MNNCENKISLIALIVVLFAISCSENAKYEAVVETIVEDTLVNTNETIVVKTVVQDTSTKKIEAETETILSRIFSSININKIKLCTTSSGPLTFKGSSIYVRPNSNKDGFIGHYFILNCGDKSFGRPYKGIANIYAQKLPWVDDDTTEILLDLHLFSPTITIAPFLKIGNPIDSVLNKLGKPKSITETHKDTLYNEESTILFYQDKEIILSVLSFKNKIHTLKIGKYNIAKYSFEELKDTLNKTMLARAFFIDEH